MIANAIPDEADIQAIAGPKLYDHHTPQKHITQLADCTIWLEHAQRGILLEGTATVVLTK